MTNFPLLEGGIGLLGEGDKGTHIHTPAHSTTRQCAGSTTGLNSNKTRESLATLVMVYPGASYASLFVRVPKYMSSTGFMMPKLRRWNRWWSTCVLRPPDASVASVCPYLLVQDQYSTAGFRNGGGTPNKAAGRSSNMSVKNSSGAPDP